MKAFDGVPFSIVEKINTPEKLVTVIMHSYMESSLRFKLELVVLNEFDDVC